MGKVRFENVKHHDVAEKNRNQNIQLLLHVTVHTIPLR